MSKEEIKTPLKKASIINEATQFKGDVDFALRITCGIFTSKDYNKQFFKYMQKLIDDLYPWEIEKIQEMLTIKLNSKS